MADYSNMTMAELDAANAKLTAARKAIRDEQLVLNVAVTKLGRQMELEREMKRLRDRFGPEAKIVVPDAIASGETVKPPV